MIIHYPSSMAGQKIKTVNELNAEVTKIIEKICELETLLKDLKDTVNSKIGDF